MKKEYRHKSLKYKVFFLLLVMSVIFVVTVTAVSYMVYTQNMNSEIEKTSYGVAETVAADISANHLRMWLNSEKTNDFEKCEENLINLTGSFTNLKRIMVCRMNPQDMQPVYYIEKETMKNTASGNIPYDETFAPVKDSLARGEFSGTLHTKTDLLAFVPVKESQDKVTGYVVCEVSKEEMLEARGAFIRTLLIEIGLVSAVLLLVGYIYISAILIAPLNRIESKIRKFTKDNSLGEETVEGMSKIKQCRKVSEFSKLCDCFTDLINDVSIKHNEVQAFDKAIVGKMHDALGDDKIILDD